MSILDKLLIASFYQGSFERQYQSFISKILSSPPISCTVSFPQDQLKDDLYNQGQRKVHLEKEIQHYMEREKKMLSSHQREISQAADMNEKLRQQLVGLEEREKKYSGEVSSGKNKVLCTLQWKVFVCLHNITR